MTESADLSNAISLISTPYDKSTLSDFPIQHSFFQFLAQQAQQFQAEVVKHLARFQEPDLILFQHLLQHV